MYSAVNKLTHYLHRLEASEGDPLGQRIWYRSTIVWNILEHRKSHAHADTSWKEPSKQAKMTRARELEQLIENVNKVESKMPPIHEGKVRFYDLAAGKMEKLVQKSFPHLRRIAEILQEMFAKRFLTHFCTRTL